MYNVMSDYEFEQVFEVTLSGLPNCADGVKQIIERSAKWELSHM